MKERTIITKNYLWNKDSYQIFLQNLLSKKDISFLQFNQKIITTSYEMIGVRTPILKKIAKNISKTNIPSFLDMLEVKYYEEALIEAFLISYIMDISIFIPYFKKFLIHIDNWAVCDMGIASMKIFSKHQEELFPFVKTLLNDKREYILRAGIVILMNYYLEEKWLEEIFTLIDNIKIRKYYVQMAIAWLLSISYIKFKIPTQKYLKKDKLDSFTHNKAIQKIRESTRVTKEEKDFVLTLKK